MRALRQTLTLHALVNPSAVPEEVAAAVPWALTDTVVTTTGMMTRRAVTTARGSWTPTEMVGAPHLVARGAGAEEAQGISSLESRGHRLWS